MSDQTHENTFRYAFTPHEVAARLANMLSSGAKMLRASSEFYDDSQPLRGHMLIMLSNLETLMDDAAIRVAELHFKRNLENEPKDGEL